MSELYDDPRLTVPMCVALVLLMCVLMFICCPRIEEITRLKKQVKTLRKKIDRMSKQQTAAELEHVADMEQLRGDHAIDMQMIEEEAQSAALRAKNAEARSQQSEELRRQIAEAAYKLTKEAQA